LNIQGGELQDKYDALNEEYQQSEKRAQAVRDRIASVENVSDALFDEWTAELKQYSNATLRQKSQKQLTQTRSQYAQLIKAMKRAEAKMDPVLAKLKGPCPLFEAQLERAGHRLAQERIDYGRRQHRLTDQGFERVHSGSGFLHRFHGEGQRVIVADGCPANRAFGVDRRQQALSVR
jgi:SMC interacting uncharacterized protein involved in chromosome segregation